MLDQGEWKKVAGLVALNAGFSLLAKHRQVLADEKESIQHHSKIRTRTLLEHPFVAYVIENVSNIGLVWLCLKLNFNTGGSTRHQLYNTIRLIIRNLVIVEGAILLQELFFTRVLYKNVPYFSPSKRPKPSAIELFTDWLQCNFPTSMFNAAAQIMLVSTQPEPDWHGIAFPEKSERLRVFPFLAKLAFTRVVVDIVFHIAHRLMHLREYYPYLHSRHHEHNKCAVAATNFHFTWMDIFLEAGLPLWVSNAILSMFKIKLNVFEISLIASYITWFEIASHSGKEIPYATMFPPLAPIMNAFADVDRDNIKYHETHHNLLRCNYGITQWVDILAGTHRLARQPCEIVEPDSEEEIINSIQE